MTTSGSQGPQYPLTREQFRRALATGHGRAKIHVECFGAREFRDEILEAATISGTDYSGDLVGERAGWLAELCFAAGVVEEVVAKHAEYNDWERHQRCGLLLAFSRRGFASARSALYAECGRDPYYGTCFGCAEIIELDGEAGLLFVARKLATILAESSDGFCLDEDDLEPYERKFGAGSGRALLERLAPGDPLVLAFLDGIAATEARRLARNPDPRSPRRRSLEEVLKQIAESEEDLVGLHGWGWRLATREDLERVLEAALETNRARTLTNCLRALAGAGLPPLHPAIFEWTRHPDPAVRRAAANVLGRHSLYAVRNLGLEALARGDLLVGLSLLERSALAEDADAIATALRPVGEIHEEYVVCNSVVDLLRSTPEVRDARIALHVYEWSPAVRARERAARFLSCWKAAPTWLLDECAQDASAEIREFAAAVSMGPGVPPVDRVRA